MTSPYPNLWWHHRPQPTLWAGGRLERVPTGPRGPMSPSLAPLKLPVSRGLSNIKSRNSMLGLLGLPSPQLPCRQAGKCQVWEGLRGAMGGPLPAQFRQTSFHPGCHGRLPRRASELEQEGIGAEGGAPGPSTTGQRCGGGIHWPGLAGRRGGRTAQGAMWPSQQQQPRPPIGARPDPAGHFGQSLPSLGLGSEGKQVVRASLTFLSVRPAGQSCCHPSPSLARCSWR